MTRRTKIVLGLAGGTLVVAIVVANLLGAREKKTEVETERVARKRLVATVSAPGRVQPKRQVNVSANVMGKVVHLAVEEGDRVKKGDFLLEIDPTPFETETAQAEAALAAAKARLNEANANLEQSRLELERQRNLMKKGFATDRDVLNAATAHDVQLATVKARQEEVAQAEAALRRSRHELTKVRLTSELSGVITRLNVEEGENAVTGTMNNPGTVLLTIADLSVMEAEVRVDETDVVDVKIGQHAEVEVDAFPDTTFGGTVTEVGNSPILRGDALSEQAADYQVVVTLEDSLPAPRPGLSATAEITTAVRDSALAVPIASLTLREAPADSAGGGGKAAAGDTITERAGGTAGERSEVEGVFVVEEGRARFRPVRTGIAGEKEFEVLSGLAEGDEVVTGDFEALRKLQDGDRVERKKSDAGGSGAKRSTTNRDPS